MFRPGVAWYDEEGATMERRIVTDGRVFRIQCRTSVVGTWSFYSGEYATREATQAVVDAWDAQDEADASGRWTVVK